MKWPLVILVSVLPLAAAAQESPYAYPSDPLTELERESQEPRLIWDSAQRRGWFSGRGRLALDAGETATFELPGAGPLRLQSSDDQVPPALWLSGDGKLWWQGDWTPGDNTADWFHRPAEPSPLMARLEAGTEFRGRLVVGQLDPVDSPDGDKDLVWPPGFVQANLVDQAGERLVVQRLPQDATVTLAVDGPRVLALASRPDETAPQSQYALSWAIDDAPWQQVRILRPQLSTRYQALADSRLQGGLDRHFLAIPAGSHRLRLKASVSLLARIEAPGADYFLASNEPEPTTAELTETLLDRPLTAADKTFADITALAQSNHLEGAADLALGYLPPEPGPAQQALAAEIERSQRFFRGLAPDAGAEPLQWHTAWFATTPALQLDTDQHYYLGEDLLDRLSRGLFVETGKAPLSYPLPPRLGPSSLRLAVARLGPGPSPGQDLDLWLQFDDRPIQRLRLAESVEVAGRSTPEDAALSDDPGPVPPTLAGKFAADREAGHYWPAASLVLPLPADVRRVKLGGNAGIAVALQYRASQAFDAGEAGYRELVEQSQPADLVAELHRALLGITSPEPEPLTPASSPRQRLKNQWYPLLRYLHAAQAAYLDDFRAQGPVAVAAADLEARLSQARDQARREDWPAVLEALGSAGYGVTADAYELSQQALRALGEDYLGRRQRQATAVFAPDAEARRLATADLMADYGRTQAWDSQVRLLAGQFLRAGDRETLDALGGALNRAGDSLWASQIGVLLAREAAVPVWLGAAAHQAGWRETAASLPDQALGEGDQAARHGDHERALAQWRQAGPAGLARIERLQTGQRIAGALASSNQQRRLEGIQDWLQWTLSPQQEFGWAALGHRLTGGQGFSTLVSEITRQPFSLPRTGPAAPLALEVLGPAVLRLRLSQLAPAAAPAGQMDWLAVEMVDATGKTSTRRAPLLNNVANPYLQAVDGSTGVANGDDLLLKVPAGLHQVRLSPRRHDYLAQVWQWQPTQHWAVLPPPTPLALKALLLGFDSAHLHTQDLLAPDAGTPDEASLREMYQSLRFPDQAVAPADWPQGSFAVNVDRVAVDGNVPDSPEAAHALAVALLWGLEENPGREDRVNARLAQLAEAHRQTPAIRRLATTRLQGYDWERISNSYESAGVRQLTAQPQMQSPYRRVRQALLPQIPDSALLLTGRGTEGVELFTPAAATLELAFEQPVLPYEAVVPAEVMVQLDNDPPRRIRLGTDKTQGRIALSAGEHALRLWLDEPKLQQLVTARLTLDRSGRNTPVLDDNSLTYHIAAPGRPASFYVKGPAWVRVDQWAQGQGSTDYRYVQAGWQSLTFEADDGRDRYYRLYALTPAANPRPLTPGTSKAELAAPAAGPMPPPAPEAPIAWTVVDRHAPGADLRSWEGYLSLTERTEGSEDDLAPVQGASALEAGVSHRWRHRDRRLYSRSDLLGRKFEGSQNVLGAKQWVDFSPGASNWHLGFYGDAYVQPGAVAGLAEDNPWSARVRGSIERSYPLSPQFRHKPGLSVSQRWLSLDSATPDALSELDPDVFSPYKRDHRRSLKLADRLTWMPHLDQRLYLEGAIISNESLNPLDIDHLELTAAGRQLFGAVAGEAGLRWRHYFEDDDRNSSLDRTRLFVGGNLLRWDGGANALTLRAEANYELERGDLGWRLRLGYEFNGGRLSPARRPDELDFLPLRRAQQRARVETNRLDPVYP